ncbi:LPS-assembly protein LptD [Treponema sp. TIM-1]|uniref:LPS-assembly protein LptD n=1 Tax=Treponema sp. TIM-1 TaxID=2898417 RepID=UPI00397FCD17
MKLFFLIIGLGLWMPAEAQDQPTDDPETGLTEAEAAGGEEAAEAEVEEVPQEEKILELDIKTSSLTELAAWCRSLGLSDGGSREELANRLRDYYQLSPPVSDPEEAGKRTIIVESARSSEYFTLESVDEDYARLRGDVVLRLHEGDAVHRIKAWEILFNRTRNIITATGGVEYVKEEGDTRETFRGESITVNLDDWDSVFLNGMTERSMAEDDTVFRFAGEVISRNDQEVTILTNADISNASNAEAFWSLHASRLWLLPGSDWAVLNAVLKVGEIPVFYFPFFLYPSDELVFHPVVGYRTREGTFFQTTTYILGRPKAASSAESSLTSIMGGGSDMERIREGIFLRSTGRKATDPNDTRLSLILDAYANLGFYIGTELELPSKGILGPSELSFGLGFTRNIYQHSGGYSPFQNAEGKSEWNSSQLFSSTLPYMRYRLNTKGALSGKLGTMNWTFPFYSDPFVDLDFLNRSEKLDWMKMIRGEDDTDTTTTTTTTEKTPLGSYEWRLSGSATPSLPGLAPYLSNLSISSLTSAISFETKSSNVSNDISPTRTFFYPNKFTIFSISTSISGTPLTLGYNAPATVTPPPASEEATVQDDPLATLGTPRSPWGEGTDEIGSGDASDPLQPPVLSQQFDLVTTSGGGQFTFDYFFNPAGVTELQFDHSQWPAVDQVDWSDVSSILSSFRTDGSFTFTFKEPVSSLYTTSLRFFGSASWQDYVFLNEDAREFSTPSAVNSARARTYGATSFSTSSEFITTIKPLYQNAVWGNSNIQYTLRGLIAKSSFVGTGQDPDWDILYGKWDNTNIEIHRFAANIAASVREKNQTLSLTTDLPPKDSAISEDAYLRIWLTETNIRNKINDPFESDRTWDPLYVTETLRFTPNTYLQQSMVYSPEVEEFTNLTTSLVWKGLSASFVAIRSKTYELITKKGEEGWRLTNEPEKLNMKEFKLGFVGEFKRASLWQDRLSLGLRINSALAFDLQRYTNSNFTFSMGFTLGVTNFLDLAFEATSENAVIFRYFQDLPFLKFTADLPGERNLFKDLLNSFRFDREDLRKSSGFKLRSIKLTALHHLGDWNAKLGLTMTPYLDSTDPSRPVYKLNPEISFLVQWVPVTEIKTEIFRDKDKFVFR